MVRTYPNPSKCKRYAYCRKKQQGRQDLGALGLESIER